MRCRCRSCGSAQSSTWTSRPAWCRWICPSNWASGPGGDRPAPLANFVRIRVCEQIDTAVNAASHLYYALYRRGFAAVRWEKGDFLTLLDAFALRSQRHAKAARVRGD